MTVADVVICGVTALAVFFDLRERRIPNWLVVFGLSAGLLLSSYRGLDQLSYSIFGFIIAIAFFLIPFALGWIGAGDVKYFGVVGALLGLQLLPRVLFYSAIVAGLMAIGYLIAGRCDPKFFGKAWADWKLAMLTFGRILPDSVSTRVSNGAASVPWGVAFAIGTIFAYYIDSTGTWAGF